MNSGKVVRITAVSWNLEGTVPPHDQLVLLSRSKPFAVKPTVILFCTQECQRSLFMSFFCENKGEWEAMLVEVFKQYSILASEALQGIHTAVLVLKTFPDAHLLSKNLLKAGPCNMIGNKGAISILFKLNQRPFQIINCHLEANHDQVNKRNQTIHRVMNGLADSDQNTDTYFLGDFNYRINMTLEEYQARIAGKQNDQNTQKYMSYVKNEQLTSQSDLKSFLQTYEEGAIRFPPTYKLSEENNEYNRQRVPGWTDRIFHRRTKLTRLILYGCETSVIGSDHRPVYATFDADLNYEPSPTENYIPVGPTNKWSKCCLI